MSSVGTRPAGVTVEAIPIWRLRAAAGLTRWLCRALILVGILGVIRGALGSGAPRAVIAPVSATGDLEGAWLAVEFARAYLTWRSDGSGPAAGLAAYLGSQVDPDAGLRPAQGSSDRVLAAQVAAVSRSPAAGRAYVVALDTTRLGRVYLRVSVARVGEALGVIGYPAFVAAPSIERAGSLDLEGLSDLVNAPLAQMLQRALGNYVAGASTELAADLAPGVSPGVPVPSLTLVSIDEMQVAGPAMVRVTLSASDGERDVFTSTYTVGVAQRAGRWEITSLTDDP